MTRLLLHVMLAATLCSGAIAAERNLKNKGEDAADMAPPVAARPMLYVSPDQANYRFASPGLWKAWAVPGGTWIDCAGVKQGEVPCHAARVATGNIYHHFDVTAIVKGNERMRGLMADNTGILIRNKYMHGNAPTFASKEAPPERRPKLTVITTTGTHQVPIVVDTWTSVTTNRPLGSADYFAAGSKNEDGGGQHGNAILTFDLTGVTGKVVRATLSLFTLYFQVHHDLEFYRLDLPELLVNPAQQHPELVRVGLAAHGEDALCAHPSVLDCMDLSSVAKANADCSEGWIDPARSSIGTWPQHGVRFLRVRNEKTNATAINCRWLSVDRAKHRKPYSVPLAQARKHIFMRYAIKVPASVCKNDYLGTKLPAPEGAQMHYANQPWVGEDYIPENAQWGLALNIAEPCTDGMVGIVPYAYHQDHQFDHPDRGDTWPTHGAMIPGREDPYTIEIEIKVNAVTGSAPYAIARDGVMRVWLDGVLIFEKTDIAWSGHPNANILSYAGWRIMHGGNGTPNGTNEYEIGAMAIATEYIGPLRRLARQ